MTESLILKYMNEADTSLPAPEREPQRQYYFMKLLKPMIENRSQELGRPLTYHIETFGCQMNSKDSEKLGGVLKLIGYKEVDTEKADFVIYNTCTVRENANTKVYGRIGYLGNLKSKNPDMIITVCGCMAQEPHVVEKIQKSYKYVDIVFGTHNIYKLAELTYDRLTNYSKKPLVDVYSEAKEIVEELPSELKFTFKAGVNIMYGCNNFCSYCIVPYVRGRERSRKPEDIVNEVKMLADRGVIEVMLLGQNVNSYGKDLESGTSFPEILRLVSEVDGIKRIRFMTPHPKDLSDELIKEIAANPKVCKHVHLPMQSGSTEILKRMNRKYSKEAYLELVERIKAGIPNVALTTDIIVGFPGETDEDFNDTVDVIEKAGFTSAYTFQYSKRRGTPAANYDNQIPEEVVTARFDKLLSTIHTVTENVTNKATGSVANVLVEECNESKGTLTGRLDNNLLVHFEGDKCLLGQIVKVRLEECKGFYYFGSLEL